MDLGKITGIIEIDMKFEVKFELFIDWFDKRLTWMHLLNNKSLNILIDDEISKIWTPTLVFKNTEQEEMTRFDNSSIILIEKATDFETDQSDLHETTYFPGSENPISYSRMYTTNFLCQFELQRYPFDTQTCEINIRPIKKELNFVKLIPSKLKYSGPKEMLTYSVIDYGIRESEHGSVVVTVKLKRMVSRHILSTYLPSLCILIIAQVIIISILIIIM